MANDIGHNPMRWDCEKNGCFNKKRRPKIEAFSCCFPGRVNFGDVDGIVELNGKFCMLEWKGSGGEVKKGQIITYKNFTKTPGNVVFIVNGDAETMEISDYCVVWDGKPGDWIKGNLEDLRERIAGWVRHVAPERCTAIKKPEVAASGLAKKVNLGQEVNNRPTAMAA